MKTTARGSFKARKVKIIFNKILCFAMTFLIVFFLTDSLEIIARTRSFSDHVVIFGDDEHNQTNFYAMSWYCDSWYDTSAYEWDFSDFIPSYYFGWDTAINETDMVVTYYFGWESNHFLNGMPYSVIEYYSEWDPEFYAANNLHIIVEYYTSWEENFPYVDKFPPIVEYYFGWVQGYYPDKVFNTVINEYYFGWEPGQIPDEGLRIINEYYFGWEPGQIPDEGSRIIIEYYFGWEPGQIPDEGSRTIIEYYFGWELGSIHDEGSRTITEYYFGWESDYYIECILNIIIEYYFGWEEGSPYHGELMPIIEYYFGWIPGYHPDDVFYTIIEYYFGWDQYNHPDDIFYTIVKYYFGWTPEYFPEDEASVIIEYYFGWTPEYLPEDETLMIVEYYLGRTLNYDSANETPVTHEQPFDWEENPNNYHYKNDLYDEEVVFVMPDNTATLNLSIAALAPTSNASMITVTVTSNRTWNVTSDSISWLTVSNFQPLNRNGNGSFRINVTANTGTAARIGRITVTAPGAQTRIIVVTQAAPPAALSVSLSAWSPTSAASFAVVNVLSNRTWNATSNASSWLTVSNFQPANRTGNGSFRINVTANTTLGSRTGTITITAPGAPTRTITVTQSVAPATLSISNSSWSPTAASSASTINVISNRTWNATSDNISWLTVSNFQPANRTGNGSFTINATANIGTTSRTGRITVTAPGAPTRTITVTQAVAPPSLNISQTTWNPTSGASAATINVTSNRTWNATSNATSWLTVSNFTPTNRTGNGSFKINATTNTGTNERSGTITVTAPGTSTRFIMVTQPAAPATLNISQTAWNPTSGASAATINVTSNRTWNATSDASWLTVSNFQPTNRTGNGSFRINTTTNNGASTRTGRITVSAPGAPTHIITVIQAVAPPTLTVSQTTWNPTASISTATISVNSNRTWNATSDATTWLTVSNFQPANRTGNGAFVINTTANTGTAARTGRITVSAPGAPTHIITVTQAVAPATLNISQTMWTSTSDASAATINVTSNRTWNATSNATSWLTVSNFQPTNRTGNGSFRINTTINTGTNARSGTITVTAPGAPTHSITVVQIAAPVTLTISQTTWNPTAMESFATINVISNRTWNVTSDATSWLTVSNFQPTNHTGNGSFRINATENTTNASRTGTITVTAPNAPTRTITVTQAFAPAMLALSRITWNPTSTASFATVNVISNRTWNATSNATSWLTVSNFQPTSRTGSGSFIINATENTTLDSRTGTITVTAPGAPTRTITVTQSIAPATLTISQTTWNPTAAAGFATINVTSNRTWNATSNATSWLTISNFQPTNRTGNGSFRINATANTETSTRTGTITVTAPGASTRFITVTQLAAPATLTISQTTWNPTATASFATINVISNQTWNATSNATSWLTVSNFQPTNRTGNGSFRINVTENTTLNSRTGTITVTAPGAPTRTITVTQAVAPATLTISQTIWSPVATESFATINVISNRTWNATSNATSWLTVSNFQPTNRTGNGSFRIHATENTVLGSRTGTITVTAPGAPTRIITVTQSVAPATLTISQTTWNPIATESFATINVSSNRTWNATSNATSWLTISNFHPTNRTGNGSFRIHATANTTNASRTGTITVTAPGAPTQTIVVTQAVAPALLAISQITWSPTAGVSSAIINVHSNRTWNATSNAISWLTVSNFQPTNRTGSGSFMINATANTGTTRTGTITVTAPGAPTRTINVTQSATPGTLTISQTTWNPTASASSATINVQSNRTWNAVSNNATWLTVSDFQPANRTGNGSFRIHATTNTESSARIGTITVTTPGAPTHTITVTQAAAPASLVLSQTTWNPNAAASVITIHVNSNRTWNAVSNNTTWLTISDFQPANRTGNGSFIISATENTTHASRTGVITITAPGAPTRTITVTQATAPATLTISQTTWNPTAASGVNTINVNSNRTWDAISNNTSWLTVSNFQPTNRTGNGSFRINVTANIGTTRTGTITITAPGAQTRTITVTQAAASAALTISQTTWNPTAAASSATIHVTSNRTWNATSNATSWLTVSHFQPANRTGNGSFMINTTTNTGLSARIGTITVTAPNAPSQIITVTQSIGGTTTLIISQHSWTPTAAAGQATINVTSNGTWNAISNASSWLTVSNFQPINRTGNGSFRINVTANTGSSMRTGTITVTAPNAPTQTITVNQSFGYSIILNPNGGFVSPPAVMVPPGNTIGNLPTPSRPGHSFVGWFDAHVGGSQIFSSHIMPHNNLTLFARWTVRATLNPNGGIISPAYLTKTGGSNMGNLPAPTRRGHVFDGWFASFNGRYLVTPGTIVPNTDFVLYARWSLIWHSDADHVGFWPGAITVSATPTIRGIVPDVFNLDARLNESRIIWQNALGVPIGTASHAIAHISVYGGSLSEMQIESRDDGEWAGLAIPPTRTSAGTITVNGRTKTVHRYSGQSRIFITYALDDGINDVIHWPSGMVRGITVHELGHALGWSGHAPNREDVMYATLQWEAQGVLSENEIRHLRQIYEIFRR